MGACDLLISKKTWCTWYSELYRMQILVGTIRTVARRVLQLSTSPQLKLIHWGNYLCKTVDEFPCEGTSTNYSHHGPGQSALRGVQQWTEFWTVNWGRGKFVLYLSNITVYYFRVLCLSPFDFDHFHFRVTKRLTIGSEFAHSWISFL